MPFIGRDWRADGEQWTRTEIGSWERPRRLSLSSSVSVPLVIGFQSFILVLVSQYQFKSIGCLQCS